MFIMMDYSKASPSMPTNIKSVIDAFPGIPFGPKISALGRKITGVDTLKMPDSPSFGSPSEKHGLPMLGSLLFPRNRRMYCPSTLASTCQSKAVAPSLELTSASAFQSANSQQISEPLGIIAFEI